MKKQIFIATILILVSSILLFFLAYYEKVKIDIIYLLPILWIVMLVYVFRLWVINKGKLMLFFHIIVLLLGAFSFLTYQLFKKLIEITPLSSPKFTNVSNLMFNSENTLYLMIYGGILLLILDSIFFLGYLKK